MRLLRLHRNWVALAAGILAPLVVTSALVPVRTSFTNTDAALALVAVVVAAAAASGKRLAGYLAAASSAASFDFFLTKPYEHFNITTRADIETTVLLLVIGAAVTELAVWGRRQQAEASRQSGYVSGMHAIAESAAGRGSPRELISQVSSDLTRLLNLRSCTFQDGIAGVGAPARLQHDGRVTVGRQAWSVEDGGLPQDQNLELLVESGGRLLGRFLMTPADNARPPRENRLIAAALADQVGAALGRPGQPLPPE